MDRHPDVDPDKCCYQLDVCELELDVWTLQVKVGIWGSSRQEWGGLTYLMEACGGKVTESEKLAIWQGAERNLPITLFLNYFWLHWVCCWAWAFL